MNRPLDLELRRLRGIIDPTAMEPSDPDEPLELGGRWWLVLDMRPCEVRRRVQARANLPSLTTDLWSSAADLTGIVEGLAGRTDLAHWTEGIVIGKNRRPRSRFWLEVGADRAGEPCSELGCQVLDNLLREVPSWRLYHSRVLSGDIVHHRLYALAQPIDPVEGFGLEGDVLTTAC